LFAENETKALKSLEFSSRANQMFCAGGLKVHSNRYICNIIYR